MGVRTHLYPVSLTFPENPEPQQAYLENNILPLLTVEEAAKILHVSKRTVYRLIKNHRIKQSVIKITDDITRISLPLLLKEISGDGVADSRGRR
jgi:DNA invertase Pin-like site-specific DNA recombinase